MIGHTPRFFAQPSQGAFHNNCWIQSEIELRAYELKHTINHPEFGSVISFDNIAQIEEYQRLIDLTHSQYTGWTEAQKQDRIQASEVSTEDLPGPTDSFGDPSPKESVGTLPPTPVPAPETTSYAI